MLDEIEITERDADGNILREVTDADGDGTEDRIYAVGGTASVGPSLWGHRQGLARSESARAVSRRVGHSHGHTCRASRTLDLTTGRRQP